MNRKSLSKWILIGALFVVGLYIFTYLSASNSEALQFISSTIESSPAITDRVGRVKHVSIDFLGGARIRVVGDDQNARMLVDITGTRGKVKMRVYATKLKGVWTIHDSTIDGQPIVLAK